MRVSDLVKDVIFLVGSVECFAQVRRCLLRNSESQSRPAVLILTLSLLVLSSTPH